MIDSPMHQSSRKATARSIRSGVAGAAIGSTAWLLILGLAISDPLLIAAAPVLALLTIVGAEGIMRRPERHPILTPSLFVWIGGFNLLFLNLYFEEIPKHVAGISTGKTPNVRLLLNVMLASIVIGGILMFFSRRRQTHQAQERA
ncbi:MAG: hypothetical protein V3T86_17870 [Planctomycetota bacterium]